MALALVNQSETSLEVLADQFIAAKTLESKANKQRVAIEEQIVAMVGAKEEGAQTTELNSGMKLTITGKLSYKADMLMLQEICASLPTEFSPIKTEIKLDETGAKFLRANEPAIWAKLAKAITVKAAKTSVEIKA